MLSRRRGIPLSLVDGFDQIQMYIACYIRDIRTMNEQNNIGISGRRSFRGGSLAISSVSVAPSLSLATRLLIVESTADIYDNKTTTTSRE